MTWVECYQSPSTPFQAWPGDALLLYSKCSLGRVVFCVKAMQHHPTKCVKLCNWRASSVPTRMENLNYHGKPVVIIKIVTNSGLGTKFFPMPKIHVYYFDEVISVSLLCSI